MPILCSFGAKMAHNGLGNQLSRWEWGKNIGKCGFKPRLFHRAKGFSASRTWMQKSLICRTIAEWGKKGESILGANAEWHNGWFFRTDPEFDNGDFRVLSNAMIRSDFTNQTLFRELFLDGETYWTTIKADSFGSRLVMFNLMPVSRQMASTYPIRWRLMMIASVGLLMAFFGARLISSLFLVPIADLANGVVAIRHREDTYRIPLRRNDEFGVVVSAFNRLLGDLKELQYGRVVQESLLPAQPIYIPGYELHFFRAPATDLAGDYHDYFLLPDGRLVGMLGDVTGHGISAALAMAMAKATIQYQKLSGWNFPTQIMEQLNSLFFKENIGQKNQIEEGKMAKNFLRRPLLRTWRVSLPWG